jgi:DNA-3-methyladenine glycosylase II
MRGKRRSVERGPSFDAVTRQLSRCDARLCEIIRRVGPCTLKPNADSFGILVRTIISQQLSTKAALSISKRLEDLLAPEGFSPRRIMTTSDAAIRSCGLSGGKVKSLRDLCAKVLDETVNLGQLPGLGNDEVRDCLVQIHGIGPWSADMFLMFSLGRMDVLPVGDFGLRAGVKKMYRLRQLPTPERLEKLARPW